jgi:hypothetical protein
VTRTESSAEFTLPAEAENQIEVPALPTEFPGETHDEVSNAPPSEQAEHLHVAESETHAEGGPREFELRSPAPVDESGSLSMPVGIGDQEFSTADLPVPSLGLQSEPVAEVIPILSGMPNEGLFASVHETANESGQTDVDAISRESVSAEARSETTAPATASSEPQAAREAPATPEAGAAPETNAAAAELPAAQTEMEDCLERIWEQLIDAPPSRGRSMSTVILKNSKVLLSSWEVTAFLSEGGQDSEDLRRAVVARSLLVMAIDERKHSGDAASLETALAGARKEVSYFQVRVEQSKRDKNVEAAVNLSISTKRLLSSLEVAEALRP